jgi:hypothetical protein
MNIAAPFCSAIPAAPSIGFDVRYRLRPISAEGRWPPNAPARPMTEIRLLRTFKREIPRTGHGRSRPVKGNDDLTLAARSNLGYDT